LKTEETYSRYNANMKYPEFCGYILRFNTKCGWKCLRHVDRWISLSTKS